MKSLSNSKLLPWLLQFVSGAVVLPASVSYATDFVAGDRLAMDAVIWFEQTVLHAVVFTMLWSAFTGKLPITSLLPIMCAGHFSSENLLVTYAFHYPFSALGLYPSILVNPETDIANPQSGTVMGFALIWLLLLLSTLRKRSFDRIAVGVLAASVAATGLLFHIFTVTSINLQRGQEIEMLRNLAATESFLDTCGKIDVLCGRLEVGSKPGSGVPGLDEVIMDVGRYAFEHPEGGFFHGWHGSASLKGVEGSNYVAVVSRIAAGSKTVWAASLERPAQRLNYEKTAFSAKAGIAHIVWLLGTFAVCWLHSSRRRAHAFKKLAGSPASDQERAA